MRIKHNSAMVKKFTDIILKKYYEESIKGRKGLHRGDAICCPLKTYYRLTGELKPQYTSRDVGTLILGTLAHIALHKNFKFQEKVYKLQGIYVTVDAIYEENGVEYPVETKSTRKRIYRKEDLLESWIEQLSIAMAVMKVNKGYLMVLNIINFSLTVWEITLTDEERQMFLQSCIWQIMSITDAINKQDPSILTPKYSECKYCPYRKQCKYYKKPPKK